MRPTAKQEPVYKWPKEVYFTSSMMMTGASLQSSEISSQRLIKKSKKVRAVDREVRLQKKLSTNELKKFKRQASFKLLKAL
jgi:hypothetical protein